MFVSDSTSLHIPESEIKLLPLERSIYKSNIKVILLIYLEVMNAISVEVYVYGRRNTCFFNIHQKTNQKVSTLWEILPDFMCGSW